MKIDRTKLKKSSSEVPPDCKALIEKLKSCNCDELLEELSSIKTWNCGKCELYHWIDVLDVFDHILEISCERKTQDNNHWCLPCDEGNDKPKQLLLCVLQFTALLIEHSFSRHFYNSMEHLTLLLSSSDMNVVLAVLNLLYVFSKRSNFITRLPTAKRQTLLLRLLYLAESWGGKENGFGLAECCQNLPINQFPPSASTLHFEYYAETEDENTKKKTPHSVIAIHIDNVDQIPNKSPSEIMQDLVDKFSVPEDKQMQLYTHVRLAHSFSDYPKRILCVQARLQALSVLVYCNAVPENAQTLLYNGLIEELVDVLELPDQGLIEIKAAALRTMTSIIHLDRNPKLNLIIDTTGAASYHGFLPVLVRNCIQSLIEPAAEAFPLPFATALFSFLYHLASYESGGDALVSCGMMEALLKVINWHSTETEHITFVTRAVRVIDLITNLDMQAFQTHGGLASFINRLEIEVNVCRLDQPFLINPRLSEIKPDNSKGPEFVSQNQAEMDVEISSPFEKFGANVSESQPGTSRRVVQCFPQRAALLKSMLNFLKKSIQDPAFSDNIRTLMDGSLSHSLKHVISNAEYYGPSLFLLATDVVTVYIFQEPTLLLPLQQSGLTDVMLHALLIKEVPATREVLASLPNVFSALCLNTRGLKAFVACKPFEKLFRVLISPEYLPAMRRRRSADPIGDAASNLGNAMDELMRHQPSLRADATAAIIKLLEELSVMGRDPKYICTKPTTKPETAPTTTTTRMPNISNDASSDDEEEDDDDTSSTPVNPPVLKSSNEKDSNGSNSKTAVPLVDYILNVMRFVDAILSNNSTDDHCREFVKQKGLVPLMSILGLPNLPIDFPVTPTCQAISSVCKSILNLAHEPQVLKQGLLHLNEVLHCLEQLHRPVDPPGGSVLLEELISAPNVNEATQIAQSTPLLHYMSAAHAYIIMFIHICRTGQSDIRTISVSHWGSELGLNVLKGLSSLYTSLVWESTVLLALCSNDSALAEDIQFGRQQLEKLLPKDAKSDKEDTPTYVPAFGSNGVLSAMEALSTGSLSPAMDIEDSCHCISSEDSVSSINLEKPKVKAYSSQIKQIKPLLSGASRLGRALAELFGLLVKLCVGSPMRQRRGQQIPPSPSMPSPAARAVASALTRLLALGLSWEPPPATPVPKFRLTFYICSVGFASPMLFDERKYPYHLMLQKFLSNGGLDAFFNCFRWALTFQDTIEIGDGLEHPEFPDSTGEFLDSWLMLLEKMCNPKTILDSPHILPAKTNQSGNNSFNPLHFLIHIQKRAFESVLHLWERKLPFAYGDRIAESLLTIICHIFKAEAIIKVRLSKEKLTSPVSQPSTASTTSAPAASTASGSTTRVITPRSRNLLESDDSGVNQDHLTQLVDMGFSRGLATEALLNTVSLEQATEYLLTYPTDARRNSPPATNNTPNPEPVAGRTSPSLVMPIDSRSSGLGMDWEMSEEDQMLRAIAMSLGENVLVSTNQGEEETNGREKTVQEFILEYQPPLSSEDIDKFTDTIVDGSLSLVDDLPEAVYRCCDVLLAVAVRNGKMWQTRYLVNRMANEINEQMYYMIKRLCPDQIAIGRKNWVNNTSLPWMPNDPKFAVRLHLFTLLFEELKYDFAAAVESKELISTFVTVLELASLCLKALQDEPAPKWLSFILLIIDLYEKAAVTSKRKALIYATPNRQWKWFDDRTGKWNCYSPANNKALDEAYKAGESSLRFNAGRRNYMVQISTMVQINEETGNWRPIMLTSDNSEKENGKSENKEKESSEENVESQTTEESGNAESTSIDASQLQTTPLKVVKRLKANQCRNLVRFCVRLLKVPLDADTLHAVMRLCLRLTRRHSNAVLFANMDGPKTLLSLTQHISFAGFTSLTALLFRHILEDCNTLSFTMEKVIRSAASGASGQTSLPVSKEMHYVFRVLGPAACRDPDIFKTVATNTLRLAILPASKREDDDRYPACVQMLKTTPNRLASADYAYDMDIANDLMYDLLSALIAKDNEELEDTVLDSFPEKNETQSPSTIGDTRARDILQCDDEEEDGLILPLPLTLPNVAGFSSSSESLSTPKTHKDNKDESKDKKPDKLKTIPIIRKSGICRLLAELVRSYPQCARLVADYSFQAGDSELITEDCTALAFVLDNLLHTGQTCGDKETPTLSRVLIAALASCNHSYDAQTTLVHEVRLALLRALSLPESMEKHQRVQALTGLISMMIDACPPPLCMIHSSHIRPPSPGMNNIVKTLLRKGVVVDLARVPHYLDLSSPYMAATINSALKPLETLSRIVNMPSSNLEKLGKGKKSSSHADTRDSAPEAMEEDSSARCSADVAMPFRGSEVQDQDIAIDSTLEGLMSEILDRHDPISERPTTRSRGGSITAEQAINVTVEMDSTSRIGTRRSATFVNPPTRVPFANNESAAQDQRESSDSDSNSESGHSRSDEEGDRDDRADEEEEEEEDDPRFDENGEEEDYSSMDFFRVQDRDDSLFFQLEEVFPASSGSSVIFGGTGADAVRTFQIPVVSDEGTPPNNESPAPSAPAAPRTVPTVHPLLVREEDSQNSQTHRPGQRRQRYRASIGDNIFHMYATPNGNGTTRQQNPPVILQSSQPSTTTQSRVVFANSDFRILATEDEDQTNNLGSDNSNTLSAVSSTLNRWAEEARVLDGDSIHDCITVLKPSIIKTLEVLRQDEIIERKEKRRKLYDKGYEKPKEGIVLCDGDRERLAEERRTTTMEVAAPASQFESEIAAARNLPLPNVSMPNDSMPDDTPTQEIRSLSTERLAASIVEQVLGPALAITSNAGFLLPSRPTTASSETRPSTTLTNFMTSHIPEVPSAAPRLHHFDAPSTIATPSSSWHQPPTMPEHNHDISSFSDFVAMAAPNNTSENEPNEARASAFTTLEPSAPYRFITPAADIETIDLIDADSSNDVQDMDMIYDYRERVQNSDVSGSSNLNEEHASHILSQPPDHSLRISEISYSDMMADVPPPLLPVSCLHHTVQNVSSCTSDDNTITVINLADSPGSPNRNTDSPNEEPSSSTLDTYTEERSSVIASTSYDNTVIDAPPGASSTSRLSEDFLVNAEPDESASPSNSNDAVLHQPRISTPSLISDDAVPCERPTVQESSSTPCDFSNVLGAGIEIPEGVDPSFLAALPDNIRQEVIAEQLRLQRIRQRANAQGGEGEDDESGFTEVNPEFLAALPLNIQEEVLAQQRAEQQRLAAINSNPDIPVDPTSFIQTLPQGLRQQVLADMDDSLLALLPSELATEAHSLRRELEARHRQIQERFFSSHAGTALSRILRSAGRVGARYTIHSLPHRGQWTWNTLSPRGTSSPGTNPALAVPSMPVSSKLRGRYLLDCEALACLIVLLFVDEPLLNTGRLHRVLRNLCHYAPTRDWVVKSLLSVLERTSHYQADDTTHRHKKLKSDSSTGGKSDSTRASQPSWLSISLDGALGSRTNVFQIRRLTTARRANERQNPSNIWSSTVPLVSIHPLASLTICKHILDTLISLAKSFPVHFLPETGKDDKSKDTPKEDHKPNKGKSDKAPPSKDGYRSPSDFWDVLVKLDANTTTSRRGKSAMRNQNTLPGPAVSAESEEKNGFKSSPLAQLIGLLAHPVVKNSSQLTDKLLRLLALISLALPEPKTAGKGKPTTDEIMHLNLSDLEDDATLSLAPPKPKVGRPRKGRRPKVQPQRTLAEMDEETALKHYLKLAVQVLTSKNCCSEEGLEDATALLLRLSRGCVKTKRFVLFLLLDGARQLGGTVCKNIRSLMLELRNMNSQEKDIEIVYDTRQAKGIIKDRFTKRNIVISAIKVKGRTGKELQLPSMSSLTTKASSQAFFLRILKVIIQLLESTPLAQNKNAAQESEAQGENQVLTSANSDSSSLVDPAGSGDGPQAFSSLWDLDLVAQPVKPKKSQKKPFHLSEKLRLEDLWTTLGDCLKELAETPDHHAVLVLQPAVEAFFLVHATLDKGDKKKESQKDSQENEISHIQDQPPMSPLSSLSCYSDHSQLSNSPDASASNMASDTVKFLKFAETHRTVLNQILRQSTTPLADGPFAVLVDHTRVLDFDIKRKYFRQELERLDEGSRREDLAVHVRREHVFEDSFRELHRRSPEEWKNRFYIVFEGEEGQDAGGLLREWYTIISREIFNPMYALFLTSPGDRVTYMINSASHCNSNHLSYFKFVGRVIAKAVYDNKLLESYFTRSFYKHILGKSVKYTDMESEDYSFYQGLAYLQDNAVGSLGYDLTFSVEVQEFGVTEVRDLKPNGRNIPVTEETKFDYVKLVCQEKMTGAIRKQLKAFLEGFYEIIPKRLISIFNEQELELLISGLPVIDIDDLKANTEYHKYQATSLQIQWFWRALRSFDNPDRANFLQFVTGTSKVPLQGFAALEGMNGTQKFQIHKDDRSTNRLPSAHTCFNQLDLPAYETYDKLRSMLLKAIHECSEGFGFA
ncbi:hypothetical protein JTE90_015857 [Oedothorax gibbosus]|uniref:E3 ubiquitin-protein ligase TRIP12 n=1 Tax=Oedothorax gibbosus TaxID=931172 RepID=A0AAV6VT88_9ARAC|nr:hypothetical protein JTE90_015857 [Oedothorax gibbosus]